MHLHQVLTGAVNPGDNCYSVGSVEDIPFTVSGGRAFRRPGGRRGRGRRGLTCRGGLRVTAVRGRRAEEGRAEPCGGAGRELRAPLSAGAVRSGGARLGGAARCC